MMNIKRVQLGFTLIELMVVVIILAIMAAFALPNMSRLIASQRLQSKAEQLVSLFQFSRSEALRLNLPVVVCPTTIRANSANANVCNDSSHNNQPVQGYLAWKDVKVNNHFSADQVIRAAAFSQNNEEAKMNISLTWFDEHQSRLPDNIDISSVRFVFLPDGQFGIYDQKKQGWSVGKGYALYTLTDTKNKTLTRKILVDPSGRGVLCDQNQPQTSICAKS